MLDLDAYLARIGLGSPRAARDWPSCIARTSPSIPFENLDPRRGVPVSLEPDDLEDKLVRRRRGGYCFEQNLLLKAALEAHGFEVDLFLARVRVGRPAGHSAAEDPPAAAGARPTGATGMPTSASAAARCSSRSRSARAASTSSPGWRYRVVQDGPELVLQTRAGRRAGSTSTGSSPSRPRSSMSRPATGSPARIRGPRSSPDWSSPPSGRTALAHR